jgi:hypothetical protein
MPHSKMTLITSQTTNYNAGAGNMTIEVRGGLAMDDTHALITSCFISTQTSKGICQMPYNGTKFMSIGFQTAVTGGSANTIDLLVYNEVGS